MNKEKVVAVMVEHINNQNRMAAAMQSQGPNPSMTLAQVEQYIIQTQPQTEMMCSGIYDVLVSKGIITPE